MTLLMYLVFYSHFFFADDSNMFVSDKNHDELPNIMNAEMTKIVDWLRTNELSLNLIKKTHFIIFRKKRGKNTLHNNLIIDDVVDRT